MTNSYPPPILTALENANVNELFQALDARTPINFTPSAEPGWGCKTINGRTEIEYSDSQRPTEALAHELLHTELKLDGYTQYLTHVAKSPCSYRPAIGYLLKMLDNELQHVRMDQRFLALGLDLKYFYEDADVNAFKQVRRQAEKLKGKVHVADFFRLYVTLLAPGGPQSDIERSQTTVFLFNKAPQRIQQKLQAIEAIFMDWRDANTLDAGPYIKRILEIISLERTYWVSYDTDFPDSGFFVGQPFEIKDAEGS